MMMAFLERSLVWWTVMQISELFLVTIRGDSHFAEPSEDFTISWLDAWSKELNSFLA